MEIGSKGLQEVNLTIPQSTSLIFDVVHKTDTGEIIDHSGSTAHMAFQETRSSGIKVQHNLDSCCTCSSEKILISIPASVTENLPLGKMMWDLIITTVLGEQVRLCYGKVNIVDTYALDEV